MASDDYTRQQHDIVPPTDELEDIDNTDQKEIDSEDVEDIDKAYETGFGNLPDQKTIDEEIDKDEIAIVKDLPEEEQNKFPKSSPA